MKKSDQKILFFMPLIGGGGVEKNFFLIAKFLSKKFKKIYICSTYIKNKPKLSNNIIFLNRKNTKIKNHILIYLISLFKLFKFLLSHKDVTILSFQANIYCIIISKLFKSKVIIRSNASPSGWANNYLKKNIFKYFLKKSDEIIVNSRLFQREMKRNFNVKSKLIYNPLNKNEVIKLSKINKKVDFFDKTKNLKILNIGRMTKQKDQLTLLKSINQIKNKLPLRLIIMGSGKEKEKLLEFIKINKLNNFVKLVGYHKNPFNVLKKANLFILSSVYEGLPNVLLEAAALKKFIISSDCPTGPSEILGNGNYGLLFRTSNYKDLANKILIYNSMNLKKKKLYITKLHRSLKIYDYQNNLNKYFEILSK